MKTQAFHRQDTPSSCLIKSLLLTINLFFILFSIVNLLVFLRSPGSGRLSTLVCSPDDQGRSLCTVTITGVREIYREYFWADDFLNTYYYNNDHFSLEQAARRGVPAYFTWGEDISGIASSSDAVCSLSFLTKSRVVDFIPPYQSCDKVYDANDQIAAAFVGDQPAIRIRFNGYSPSILWRIVLLSIAVVLLAGQFASWFIRRRRVSKENVGVEKQEISVHPEGNGSRSNPQVQAAEEVDPSKDMIAR